MSLIVETSCYLPDEAATLAFAATLATELIPPCSIALHGPLGAGKTTFVRGVLRTLGVSGAIKSPTYALVETYDTPLGPLHHFDAYRIQNQVDFESRGGMEYFAETSIRMIEWPERVAEFLAFDAHVYLLTEGEGRRVIVSGKAVV